jgi:hypothetical protein
MPIKLIKLGNLPFNLNTFLIIILEFYFTIYFLLFYNESNNYCTTKNISIPKLAFNYFALW